MQRNRPEQNPTAASAGLKRSAPPQATRGLAPRRLAAYALLDITDERLTLDEALERQFAEPEGIALDSRDQALTRAIVTAACRRLGTIHAALNERMPKGIPAKSGLLPEILIVGAAQILLMDIPDRAAVDLAVHHARADRRAFPYSKLVNAVLRRVAESRDAILATDDIADIPQWLARRWQSAYGMETVHAIARAHRQEPGVDVTVKGDPDHWAQALNGLHLPGSMTVRLAERAPIASLPGYAEGAWWVQDAAATLPARLLAARPGQRILDMCAAPGGKTAQLAAAGATVTALDRSEPRLVRLRENLARLGLEATVVAQDARRYSAEPFDAVLLDAPCSATGTIRRHPDVAWTRQPADIDGLTALQAQLLDRTAELVQPGGMLVYSTCSLEPEEGEQQITAFLARHPDFKRKPVTAEEIPHIEGLITKEGDIRTLPSHLPNDNPRLAGLDGFFVARLLKTCG